MIYSALILLCMTPAVSAFLPVSGKADAVRSDLMDVTRQQLDTKLDLRLNLGQKGQSQMAITGLTLELANDAVHDDARVKLPGYDGPHPELSCGPRRLDLVESGKYVDIMGTQRVEVVNACWEMSWRHGKPAGTLICGFEVPKEHRRNQATLPKGIIYCSFPLWTKDGLVIGQAQKAMVQKQARELLAERDAELEKYNSSRNPVMKALYLRKAIDAFDRYDRLPLKGVDSIPSANDVLELQEDLLLTKKGMIWVSHGDFKDAKHTVLGSAVVSSAKAVNSALTP